MQALRALRADVGRPPTEQLAAMRRAQLLVSLDSGLALPDLIPHSDEVIAAWWRMHLAGVDAMEGFHSDGDDNERRTTTEQAHALAAWKSACAVFATQMEAARAGNSS